MCVCVYVSFSLLLDHRPLSFSATFFLWALASIQQETSHPILPQDALRWSQCRALVNQYSPGWGLAGERSAASRSSATQHNSIAQRKQKRCLICDVHTHAHARDPPTHSRTFVRSFARSWQIRQKKYAIIIFVWVILQWWLFLDKSAHGALYLEARPVSPSRRM